MWLFLGQIPFVRLPGLGGQSANRRLIPFARHVSIQEETQRPIFDGFFFF
jgi:hypothetical protein